jgi:exopolyphosphatase/pppGpp-phosphohydrolase
LKAAQGILDAHRASLADISTALEAARQQQQQQQPSQQQVQSSQVAVVVTGGTATTLAALHLELEEYCHEAVHMSVLTRQQVEQLMQQYLKQSFVQGPPASMSSDSSAGDGRGGRGRSDWPSWLTPARASSLAPGCAGLLVLMDWLGCQELVVSDCDLLDGAVAHMQQEGAALTWGL